MLHDGSKKNRQIYDKLQADHLHVTPSYAPHHHVKMKRVLGIEVLKLTQDGKHFLLPHLHKDHLVDQDRYLQKDFMSLISTEKWTFLHCVFVSWWHSLFQAIPGAL